MCALILSYFLLQLPLKWVHSLWERTPSSWGFTFGEDTAKTKTSLLNTLKDNIAAPLARQNEIRLLKKCRETQS